MTIRGGAPRPLARLPLRSAGAPGDRDWRSGAGRPETAQRARRDRDDGAAGGGGLQRRGRARHPAETRAGRGRAARPRSRTEQALIARYHAAMAGSPGLAGTLGPLLAQHREHLARLTSMLIDSGQLPVPPRGRRPPPRRARRRRGRRRSPRSRRPRPPRPARWPGGWPWLPRPWPSCSRASRPPRPATPCCCARTGRPDDRRHGVRPPRDRPARVRRHGVGRRDQPARGRQPRRCSPRSPR